MLLNTTSCCLLLTPRGASKAKAFTPAIPTGENTSKQRCAEEKPLCPLWSSLVASPLWAGWDGFSPLRGSLAGRMGVQVTHPQRTPGSSMVPAQHLNASLCVSSLALGWLGSQPKWVAGTVHGFGSVLRWCLGMLKINGCYLQVTTFALARQGGTTSRVLPCLAVGWLHFGEDAHGWC